MQPYTSLLFLLATLFSTLELAEVKAKNLAILMNILYVSTLSTISFHIVNISFLADLWEQVHIWKKETKLLSTLFIVASNETSWPAKEMEFEEYTLCLRFLITIAKH